MFKDPKKTAPPETTKAPAAGESALHPEGLKPWEDRLLSPNERFEAYKAFVHEKLAGIAAAFDRAGEANDAGTQKEIMNSSETKQWVEEGTFLKTASAEELCERLDRNKPLTPRIFLARYNVEVINDHTVSFVIPEGVSRIEILKEAKGLVTDRNLIYPLQYQDWANDPRFTTKATNSERISIDGHVPDSEGKRRRAQEIMVGEENLPTLEDLAVAFAVNWIATGEPLFGWFDKSTNKSYSVRAAGGALGFPLFEYPYRHTTGYDVTNGDNVAVSSRALRPPQDFVSQAESKNVDSGFLGSGLRGIWTLAKRGLGFDS